MSNVKTRERKNNAYKWIFETHEAGTIGQLSSVLTFNDDDENDERREGDGKWQMSCESSSTNLFFTLLLLLLSSSFVSVSTTIEFSFSFDTERQLSAIKCLLYSEREKKTSKKNNSKHCDSEVNVHQ